MQRIFVTLHSKHNAQDTLLCLYFSETSSLILKQALFESVIYDQLYFFNIKRRAITLYCTQQSEDKLRELFSSSIMCVIVTFLTADTLTSWAILATSLLPVLIDYPWLKPYKKVRIFLKFHLFCLWVCPRHTACPRKLEDNLCEKVPFLHLFGLGIELKSLSLVTGAFPCWAI